VQNRVKSRGSILATRDATRRLSATASSRARIFDRVPARFACFVLAIRRILFFQFWSAYVPCGAAQLNAVQLSLEQIDVIRRLAEMNAQHLTLVTSVKGEYGTDPHDSVTWKDNVTLRTRASYLGVVNRSFFPSFSPLAISENTVEIPFRVVCADEKRKLRQRRVRDVNPRQTVSSPRQPSPSRSRTKKFLRAHYVA